MRELKHPYIYISFRSCISVILGRLKLLTLYNIYPNYSALEKAGCDHRRRVDLLELSDSSVDV